MTVRPSLSVVVDYWALGEEGDEQKWKDDDVAVVLSVPSLTLTYRLVARKGSLKEYCEVRLLN